MHMPTQREVNANNSAIVSCALSIRALPAGVGAKSSLRSHDGSPPRDTRELRESQQNGDDCSYSYITGQPANLINNFALGPFGDCTIGGGLRAEAPPPHDALTIHIFMLLCSLANSPRDTITARARSRKRDRRRLLDSQMVNDRTSSRQHVAPPLRGALPQSFYLRSWESVPEPFSAGRKSLAAAVTDVMETFRVDGSTSSPRQFDSSVD
ncbi:hypothetical protein EVAR_4749_1 [Eumeta japonica]|uniref:Uncharacterized protein n=1 Tax=Eumeta variegata TaxID=151549 RepID=A0A4C1SZJ9_EUMVA|nr:hypothetical protein EVAR_4749_1 [Eumeta japonica]